MAKLRASASYVSKAPPEDIYALVENSATYPFWSMIEHYEMVRPGREGQHGVGARRIFRTGRNVMLEDIVELVPNRLAAYVLLSGFPMNDYRAETVLEPLASGRTKITWRCSFYPKYPGTGWFWQCTMYFVFRSFVRALARAAESTDREAILAAAQGSATSKPSRLSLERKFA